MPLTKVRRRGRCGSDRLLQEIFGRSKSQGKGGFKISKKRNEKLTIDNGPSD